MARELRSDVTFATPADADVAATLYERAFVDAFDSFLQYHGGLIHYTHQGYGAAQLPTLMAALEYAEAHCRPKDKKMAADAKLYLFFKHNEFTDADAARLRGAIPKASTKFQVVV